MRQKLFNLRLFSALKLADLTTPDDAEKRVLNALLKSSDRNPKFFNPLKATTADLSEYTSLDELDVEEALKSLEDSGRIEKMTATVVFWLPLSEGARRVKKLLFLRDHAIPSFTFFAFLLLVASWYLTKFIVAKSYLHLSDNFDFFAAGFIEWAICLWLAQKLAAKYHLLNLHLEEVRGARYFKWIFIGTLALLIVLINNQGTANTILLVSTIFVNILTVVGFFLTYVLDKRIFSFKKLRKH